MEDDNPFAQHDVLSQKRPQTGASARRMIQRQIEQISSELEGVMKTTQPLLSHQQRLKEQLALLDLNEDTENVPPDTLDRLVTFQKEAHQVLTEFPITSPVRRNRNTADSSPLTKSRLNATPKNVLHTRKMRPANTSPRHHEIDLATELGEGLVEEVRRLQAQLYEKDEALRQQVKVKQAEDRNAEDLEAKLRNALSNEEKLKGFNWELESRARDAEEVNRTLIDSTMRLEKDLLAASSLRDSTTDELELVREAHERSMRELNDVRAAMHEALTLEKEIQADLRDELTTLQSKLTQMQADLDAQKAEVPKTNLSGNSDALNEDEDSSGDILETPPGSPPRSPIKGTPHRNATLESETMKGTLFYNQAKMLRQRKELEREKTQRLQLQREVKDLQDELDALKQELGSQLPRRRANRSTDVTSKRKIRERDPLQLQRRPISEISFVEGDPDEEFWEDDDHQGTPFDSASQPRKNIVKSRKERNNDSDSDTDVTIRSNRTLTHERTRSRSVGSFDSREGSVSSIPSSPIQAQSGLQSNTMASASSADSRYTNNPRDLRDELDDLGTLESPSAMRSLTEDLRNCDTLLPQLMTREIGTMTDDSFFNCEPTVVALRSKNNKKSWTFVEEDPSLYLPAAISEPARLTFIHETQETISRNNDKNETEKEEVARQPALSEVRQSELDPGIDAVKATVIRVGGRGPVEEPTEAQITYESLNSMNVDKELTKPAPADNPKSTNSLDKASLIVSENSSACKHEITNSKNCSRCLLKKDHKRLSQLTSDTSAVTQVRSIEHPGAKHHPELDDEKQITAPSPFAATSWQAIKVDKLCPMDKEVATAEEEMITISQRRLLELTRIEEMHKLSQRDTQVLPQAQTEHSEVIEMTNTTQSDDKARPASREEISEYESKLQVIEHLAVATPRKQNHQSSGAASYIEDTDGEDAALASGYRLSHMKDLRASNDSPTAKAEKVLGKSPSTRGLTTSKSISRSLRSQRSNESIRERFGMAPPIAPSTARDTLRGRQIKTSDQRASPSKIASRSDLSNVVYGTAKIMPPRSYSERSISSLSSFASEIDEHLKPRFDYNESPQSVPRATDPATIESITRTMIGMSMYKYTRRTGRQGLSDKRHRRYFWIHPYTKTLYWSVYNPVNAPEGAIIKSAPILTVHVESDHNDMPPGLHQRSICIDTPRRMLKVTAVHSTDHEDWVRSLNFLINGPPAEEQAPAARRETDTIIRDFSPTRSPEQSYNISKQNVHGFDSQRTIRAKSPRRSLSGRVNAFFRPPSAQSKTSRRTASPAKQSLSTSVSITSIHQPELTLDSISDGFGLENVRECCGGRHDVATLCHRVGSSSRASSRSRRQI